MWQLFSPCLPACYLCEWGVISAPALWTRVHFNYGQCFRAFWQRGKHRGKSYDHTAARSLLLTSSRACHSLNMSHRLSPRVWTSTVCLWLDTYRLRLVFPAPCLTPPPAQKHSRNTTSKLNRTLHFFLLYYSISDNTHNIIP